MAANRIQGITIEIGGDTTKLQTALKGVNTEVKNTQQQLKDVKKLLKLDPGNTELLAQKHKLLGEAVQAAKEKLETLKTAAEQANTALANGDISQEQYDALQREIIETENELKRLEEQANESATALQKIQGTVAPYGYRKDPGDKHKLIVDDEAAVIVRRIFREYLSGMPANQIAKELNEEGVETPSVYQKRVLGYNCVREHKGKPLWTTASTTSILRDENHVGTFVYHKEVTKYLTWPPHSNVDVTMNILKDWVKSYKDDNYYQWAIAQGQWR